MSTLFIPDVYGETGFWFCQKMLTLIRTIINRQCTSVLVESLAIITQRIHQRFPSAASLGSNPSSIPSCNSLYHNLFDQFFSLPFEFVTGFIKLNRIF